MNLNRFFTFIKRALLVTALITTVGITACDNGDDDEGPTIFAGTSLAMIQDAQFQESATVSADVALDSLLKYLTIYPELTAMLSGSSEITFFAPSNTAFKNLIATPGFPANIKQISPDLIKGVLAYHFVDGKKMQADLTSGAVLTSKFTDPLSPAAAQSITVNSNGTLKAAPNATNIDIDIVKADNQSTNGVVHIVESVMIPPSTGAVLVPILGKVAGSVLLGKDFTNLAKIILTADAVFTEVAAEGKFKISTWLAMPITASGAVTANVQGITFFAPPNNVLGTPVLTEEIANAMIASPDKGRAFVLNHLVISNQYVLEDFATGLTPLVPLSGESKTIIVSKGSASTQNPYGVAISNNPAVVTSFRPIVLPDIAHSNGVLQVFAGALQ
jgi:uncharacterized surface protein with fasciclin (FAS1) repeats